MKKEILEKVLSVRKNIMLSGDIATGKSSNVVSPIINEIIDNLNRIIRSIYDREKRRKIQLNIKLRDSLWILDIKYIIFMN